MDRRIFEMELSVEATSLYLLLASLSEAGTSLGREVALPIWNAPVEKLDEAARELIQRGVVSPDPGGGWRLEPQANWVGPA